MGRLLSAAVVGLLIAGCGGGEVKVSRPAAERPDLTAEMMAPGQAVRMPGSQPFNLVSFTSGQSGQAQGTARTAAAGGASAGARAEAGGTSWGEFQLGYYFDNVAATPARAVIRVKVQGSAKLRASSPGAEAAASLTLFVKDSNGATLRSESLVMRRSTSGPNDWSGEDVASFDVTCAPTVGYYIFLAGRVDAKGTAASATEASLDLAKTELELEWQASMADRVPSRATAAAS